MTEKEKENLVGHPSDYGSRTIEDAEAEEEQRTADGEPRIDRGSVDSRINRSNES